MQPHIESYGQRSRRFSLEEIICPSFAQREFESQKEADEYARRVFGPQAFARLDDRPVPFFRCYT